MKIKRRLTMAITMLIMTVTMFSTAKANQGGLSFLGQDCQESANEIENSWASIFSINGVTVMTAIVEKVRNFADRIQSNFRPDGRREKDEGPKGYEYAGPRNGNCITGKNFKMKLDAMRYSPNNPYNDYRKAKAVVTKRYFETHTIPGLEKIRTAQSAYERNKAKKKLHRLGTIKLSDSKQRKLLRKELRESKSYYTSTETTLSKEKLRKDIEKSIINKQQQISLLEVKNEFKNHEVESGHQYFIAYKLEPCYVTKLGSKDQERFKATVVHVLDLDPFLNKSSDGIESASYKLFYVEGKEMNYSFEMKYRQDLKRKHGFSIHSGLHLPQTMISLCK